MPIKHVKPVERHIERVLGDAYLEVYTCELGVMPVLHVSGSPEEMGWQYGSLAGDRIRRNFDRMIAMFTSQGMPEPLVYLLLDRVWARMKPYVPERFLDEIAGIAAGAQAAGYALTHEDVERLIAVTNFDLYRREERLGEFLGEDAGPLGGPPALSCSMFAVWGSRTEQGKMFALRNLDWASQTGIHEDRLITVYQPNGQAAFVTMGYAGILGVIAGMNDRGITLSEVGTFSAREELDGTPWTLLARRVLEESDSLEDAVAIIENGAHTIGYNYLIADGDPEHFGTAVHKPNAAAFETNFACWETFYENDPKEQAASWTGPDGATLSYGLPLPEAILRADTAFGAGTRALQAADNGPGEPANDGNPLKQIPGNSYWECHRPMYDMIRSCETGAAYVFPVRNTQIFSEGPARKIGPEEALSIAATVAHNTEKLAENDWNVMSVVYAPTDLTFWAAFESCDGNGNWGNAPDSGYWEFRLADLLAAPIG